MTFGKYRRHLGNDGVARPFPGAVAILGRQTAMVRSANYAMEPKFRSRLSHSMRRTFADLATAIAYQSGRPAIFIVAAVIILVWAFAGPIFHYSDTWQLIINTGTSVVTFLMVFVIQNTQNRDGAAVQAKLDELIRVSAATNSLIGIETLTQEEIAEIRSACAARAKRGANGASRWAAKIPQAAHAKTVCETGNS
jgi:low affinity Fe/Cu permease